MVKHVLACAARSVVIVVAIASAAAAQDLPVAGTISYLGSQPVSTTNQIGIAIFDQPIGTPGIKPLQIVGVPTSSGAFNMGVPAGTYYLAYWVDVVADSAPSVGEPFQLYNGRFVPPGDPLIVAGSGVNNLSLTFDDTAHLSGIAGTVTYTGSLGPVSNHRRLIVDRFGDANLAGSQAGQNSVKANGGRFDLITFDTGTWYLLAYLDVNDNRVRDPGEPFTIYNERTATPADPVQASTMQTGIDITFGDESRGSDETPTPSPNPTATVTPTPVAVPACVGDCNGNDQVSVDEILTMVNIALGNEAVDDCQAGDANGDHQITVDELLAAVSNALSACPLG